MNQKRYRYLGYAPLSVKTAGRAGGAERNGDNEDGVVGTEGGTDKPNGLSV
jgi:hypothetical protein